MSYGYDYDSDSNSNSLLKIMMDEEDEKKKQRKKILLTAVFLSTIPLTVDDRDSSFFRNRLDWDLHVSKLKREGPNAFYSMYRMHYPSYMKLCSLIDDAVRKIMRRSIPRPIRLLLRKLLCIVAYVGFRVVPITTFGLLLG